jgi:hypothetical protein
MMKNAGTTTGERWGYYLDVKPIEWLRINAFLVQLFLHVIAPIS